ncbi:DUF262 domain-containing protein [Priestia megaterium]|uniref:DUF262 domain-containing protein n=1 Tax=Priestia megaterium TaxID=1404 RepID=UPI003000E453
MIERIDKGYELQKIDRELTEKEILDFNGAIIIAPDYQREYRFTLDDEVKLIESVLVGIPIPPIFLATDKYNRVRVYNVVDGQHRLRALYRFYYNDFNLNDGLKLLENLDGASFDDLSLDIKSEFTEVKILVTIFKDFPGLDFELEIFNRYNKGTKPLSPQEIRHAVYNSNLNQYINNFTFKLFEDKELKKSKLRLAYNITKDRIQKKKVQEGLFVILSILEYGINEKYDKSLEYAEKYMEEKSNLEKNDPELSEENFELVHKLFDDFNKMVVSIQKTVEYPFSKELYGISSRNYKFQISIAMILAGIFHRIAKYEVDIFNRVVKYEVDIFEKKFIMEEDRNQFLDIVKSNMQNSFLENLEYKASSTNSKEIKILIDNIEKDLIKSGFLGKMLTVE